MTTDKITPAHLSRAAYVYIRQSTQFQVHNNLESQRLQYALADRAKELGFSHVEIIDEDMGCSGSGNVARKGFERLVADVCLGKVGAVLSLEASRLARNNRDWHQLVDLCALTQSLIIDQDGIYDPAQLNDRLLLGLKGTMSEFELNLFRQRSWQARKQKAQRGELYSTVPAGFVRTGDDRCEQDPDLRVQQAIQTIFAKFDEQRSVRQVLLWCRAEHFLLPVATHGPQGRQVEWRLPVYRTIHGFLANPIYAGAYVFGRHSTKTEVVDGRARKRHGVMQGRENWMILIRDHHKGYISWDRYERNQTRIRENANRYGMMEVKGAARDGNNLLAGLLRCGRCGKKMQVRYTGPRNTVGYECKGESVDGGPRCASLSALRIDAAIEEKILTVVEPAAVEAAMASVEQNNAQGDERRKAKALALEQARYEAQRAARQYHAVDPENRLVASELENRWNMSLKQVSALENELSEVPSNEEVGVIERKRLMALSQDLPRVWCDERSDMSLKKRIVRTLIEEIVIDTHKNQEHIEATIRWVGGQHGMVQVRKNRLGEHRYTTDKDTVGLARELAEVMPDHAIARELNRLARKTGQGNGWNQSRVCSLRHAHGIAAYDPEKQKGLIHMQEAARRLGICAMSVRRLIERGILPGRQVIAYAPWMIAEEQLNSPTIQAAVARIKSGQGIPLPENPNQKMLIF